MTTRNSASVSYSPT